MNWRILAADPETRGVAPCSLLSNSLHIGFARKKTKGSDVAGKFEIYTDKAGEFRFRLKASNGQNILASEGYKKRASAENGIESVRKNSADDARYERKETQGGKFSFNLKSSNGQVVGTSQSYASASSRDNGIASVKKNAPDAALKDLTGD